MVTGLTGVTGASALALVAMAYESAFGHAMTRLHSGVGSIASEAPPKPKTVSDGILAIVQVR